MPYGRRSHGRHGHRHGYGRHHHHYNIRYSSWRHLQVIVPQTTEKSVVFPFNSSTLKFKTQEYTPALTNHKMSNQEVDSFLSGLEGPLVPYHEAARKRLRNIRILNALILLFIIAIAVVTPLSIIFSKRDPEIRYVTRRSGTKTVTTSYTIDNDVFPIGIPIVCGLFVLYMIIYACLRQNFSHQANMKLKECMPSLHQYISGNALALRERGLMWVVPHYFPHWIELWNLDAMKGGAFNHLAHVGFLGGYPMEQKTEIINYLKTLDASFVGDANTSINNNSMSPFQMMSQPQQVPQFLKTNQAQRIHPGIGMHNQWNDSNLEMQPTQQTQGVQQGIYMQNQFSGNNFNNQGFSW